MGSYLYEIPSSTIIDHRIEFYAMHKESTEALERWLYRVRRSADYCQFGTLRDFLLMDKFVCELNNDDIQILRNTGTWSFNELDAAVKANEICSVVIKYDEEAIESEYFNSNGSESDPLIDVFKEEFVSLCIFNIGCMLTFINISCIVFICRWKKKTLQ